MLNIEKLIDEGYSYSLINQIQKAYEKGYDINGIYKNIDIDKLRNVINELPQREKVDKNALVTIFLKVYGAEGKIKLPLKIGADQQEQMLEGLTRGVNPNAYKYMTRIGCNPKWISEVGLLGISLGLDITTYLEKGYTVLPIKDIFIAHKKGFDIEKYITTEYGMSEINAISNLCDFYYRNKIKEDDLFDKLAKLKIKEKAMNKVIECLETGKDISIILSDRIDHSQIGILLTATKKGHNLETMIDKRLSVDQLNIIMSGLDFGVDTSKFNNPALSPAQMNAISKILRWNKENPSHELDVTLFQNPKVPYYLTEQYFDQYKHGQRLMADAVLKEINKIIKDNDLER